MKTSAARAHAAVRAGGDGCRGMMTSLSLAVWQIDRDEIHFLNVGDSRIYLGAENDLQQITRDDAARELVMRGGKPLLNDGAPVFRCGVTRSLGQNEQLVFKVQTREFSRRDLLVLVSDGVSKNEAFTTDIADIFSRGDYSARLERIVKENAEKNNDDATLITLWRTECDENALIVYRECVKNKTDFRENDLGAREVLTFLEEDLIENLSHNANAEVNSLLDYADHFSLRFSREFLIDFNGRVFCQNTDRTLWLRLQDLIRRS